MLSLPVYVAIQCRPERQLLLPVAEDIHLQYSLIDDLNAVTDFALLLKHLLAFGILASNLE